MEITKIYVAKSNATSGVSVGYGSVTFDDALIVKFGVMKANDGRIFVNWPSKKGADNKWYDDVSFVIHKEEENPYEFKNSVDSEILKEFNKVVGISSTNNQAPKDSPADTSFGHGANKEEPPAEKKPLLKWGKNK